MKTFLSFVGGVVVCLGVFLLGIHYSTPTPTQPVQQNFGAVPGNDLSGPCYSVNGQYQCKYHDSFTVTASTTCTKVSPNATSSLSFFGANISSSSPNATIYELGTATIGGADPYATTTLIGTKYSVSAGNNMSITGSTTPSATGSVILGPNTRVNFKGGSPAVSPKGTCDFIFTVI